MSDTELNEKEKLLTKHRKEKKDLQAKIQAMKKNVSKDKKKRLTEEITELEVSLEKQQTQELSELNEKDTVVINACVEERETDVVAEADQHTQRISKAQKRREKKANEEKLRQADILAQEEINKDGPRFQEMIALKKILKSRGLCIYAIPSDGDCLYNAIRHQLKLIGKNSISVKELRYATANYIEKNKQNLLPYMTNNTGDSLADDEFNNYCKAIRETPAWGGQIEIQALSNILAVPIEVLQATGPPTVQGEYEFKGPNLVITYHRHMYSLGEHYNSTKVWDEEKDEDNDNVDESILISKLNENL